MLVANVGQQGIERIKVAENLQLVVQIVGDSDVPVLGCLHCGWCGWLMEEADCSFGGGFRWSA